MRCPFCSSEKTQVRDSRPEHGGTQTRRKRVCLECGGGFRTTETLYMPLLDVRKKDNRIEPFTRRNCASPCMEPLASRLWRRHPSTLWLKRFVWSRPSRGVGSGDIGYRSRGHERLRQTDAMAYLRFAFVIWGSFLSRRSPGFLWEHRDHEAWGLPRPGPFQKDMKNVKNAENASGVSESPPLDPAAQSWLQRALRFAEGRVGRTGSNPAVACLLVQNDRLVGRGRTGLGGRPHAESLALAEAGEQARGACVYVTLEPCNHHGQTGPCTEALIQAGVRRVVVGFLDPDARVRGRGLARLRAAGVETHLARGVPLPTSLRRIFSTGNTARLFEPQSATSLDGRIALASGESRWITNAAARRWSHGLRARVNGVMIGAETALRDQPRLDCRLSGLEDAGGRVILLDTSFRVPASFFRDKRKTVLIGSHAHFDPNLPQLVPLQQSGGLVLTCQPPSWIRWDVPTFEAFSSNWPSWPGPRLAGGRSRLAGAACKRPASTNLSLPE